MGRELVVGLVVAVALTAVGVWWFIRLLGLGG
jgi:hypothetical protein